MIRSVLLIAAIAFALPAAAGEWTTDTAKSHLKFRGQYQGEDFDGRFERFTPKIAFDAADASKISFDVAVDIASINTDNEERDETLPGPDWFDSKRYPQAHFRTLSCKVLTAPNYECQAELTIRDKTKAIVFPFSWGETKGVATLKAQVTVNRVDFDVGNGEWADDGMVAHAVNVDVDLSLTPKQ